MAFEILIDRLYEEIVQGKDSSYFNFDGLSETDRFTVCTALGDRLFEEHEHQGEARYLYSVARNLPKMLECGVQLFESENKADKDLGAEFLELYMYRLRDISPETKLDPDLAVKLVDHWIQKEEYLYAENAIIFTKRTEKVIEKAVETAYVLLNRGDLSEGNSFLQIIGEKLTPQEYETYSDIAVAKGNISSVLNTYKNAKLDLPLTIGQSILASPHNTENLQFYHICDNLDMFNDPSYHDGLMQFAQAMISHGHNNLAQKVSEAANDPLSPEEKTAMAIRELYSKTSSLIVRDRVKKAYPILQQNSPERAEDIITEYANSLLFSLDTARKPSRTISSVLDVYEISGYDIPKPQSDKMIAHLKAKGSFGQLSNVYLQMGQKDKALETAYAAIEANPSDFGYASRTFERIGDSEGIVTCEFYEQNKHRFQ